MSDELRPIVNGIHHVNLTVSDLARSAEWYVRVLGLTHGWDMDDIDGRGQKTVLLVPGSALRVVLSRHRAGSGAGFSEFNVGLDHLAFTVADRSELEIWVRKLDAEAVDHSPIKEGATGWLTTLRDPDNIQLELYTLGK